MKIFKLTKTSESLILGKSVKFLAKVGKTGRAHAKDVILLAKPDSTVSRASSCSTRPVIEPPSPPRLSERLWASAPPGHSAQASPAGGARFLLFFPTHNPSEPEDICL